LCKLLYERPDRGNARPQPHNSEITVAKCSEDAF
jgi:hypothetical protein